MKTNTSEIRRLRRVALSALGLGLGLALVQPAAHAASGTWNSDSAGNWSHASNWNPAAVPGTAVGDVVSLTKNLTAACIVTIDTDSRTVGALSIGDSATAFFAYTLAASGGAGLTFDNSGSGASLVQATTTAADSISAPITLADNLTVNNSGSGGLTLSGGLSGAGVALTKTGTGQLTLNSAAVNTFTGGVIVNAGTLLVNFSNLTVIPNTDLLDGDNVLTLGGGTFYLYGKNNVASAQTVASTTLSTASMSKITLGRQGSGSMTAALGTITRNGNSTLNFSNIPDTGTIIATTANGNDACNILGPWATVGSTTSMKYATVDGSGRIVTYGNGTLGTAGTLANVTDPNGNYYQSGATALTGTITANTLRYTDNTTLDNKTGGARTMTLNGLLFVGSSWTTFGNTPAQGGGDLIIGANKELVVIVQSGQNVAIQPRIVDNSGGASSLTWNGGGECNLYANTYSGGTTINGASQINMNDPSSFGTGPVTLNAGTINLSCSGKTVATPFIFNGGKLSPGYANTLSGPIYLAVTTTIDFPNFSAFSSTGVVSGPGGFTKTSGGQLTIQGVNTYSGPTILSGGSIVLSAAALLSNTSMISIAGGSTFDVSAITSYALGSSTTLAASGAASAATLKGKAGGTVNLGAQPISLTLTPTVFTGDSARPALTVSQGALTLSSNIVTVNNAAATPLGIGSYRLIQVGNGSTGSITGTPNPTPVMTGSGLAAGTAGTLAVVGGNVVLTVSPISLQVAGFPSPQAAGTAGSVTVTATDSIGNTATGYVGTVHFTSSDAAATLPADYTFVSGDSGSRTFTGAVTLRTSGTQSISATDTTIGAITGSQAGISITPLGAVALTVSGFPVAQAAGVSAGVTVTAKDSYGNTATGYSGTVHFTSSDAAADLPADYAFVSGDNGTHTFTNSVTLNTMGTQSLTATDTVTGSITGVQSGITVLPGTAAVTLSVTGLSNPLVAGTAGDLTVTAKDISNNTATGYTGTVHFTSSDAAAVLPADYTFVSGDNGTHTFTGGVVLKTAGTQAVTATDSVTSITGSQSGITVNPDVAAALVVTGFPSPLWSGAAGSVTVTAKDSSNNTVTGYIGTVYFTSTDGAATLPADYTYISGDNGVHTFTGGVTLNTAGAQDITATDMATGTITGTQAGITVNASPSSFTWTGSASGLWSNSGNWTNNLGLPLAPFAGGRPNYALTFNNSGAYPTTHDLGDGFMLNQLNLVSLGWQAFSGNSLTFVSNGAILPQVSLNGAVNFNIPLVLAADTTFNVIGGEMANQNQITGPGSLTKIGAGQLDLNSACSYAGGTTVNGGTIQATNAGALGTGPLRLNGGTLAINGGTTTNTLTLNGGTLNLTYWNAVTGPVTLETTSTIRTGTGIPHIDSVISGAGGLTSTGNLLLTQANTYSGNTSIDSGSLALGASGSINDTPLVSIAAGATFDVSAITSYTMSASTTLSASGSATAATLKGKAGGTVSLGSQPIILSYNGTNPALSISQGTLVLDGNAFTVNRATPLADGTYPIIQQASGSINGSGSFTVTGTAIASDSTGTIQVSDGSVNLVISSGASYAFWADAQDPKIEGGPAYVGPDGISNLMLYALDLKLDRTNGSPGTLTGKTVTFLKRAAAFTNGDVSYAIQVSDDLGVLIPWHKVDATSDTDTEITYLLPEGATRTFARLVVTQGPYTGP